MRWLVTIFFALWLAGPAQAEVLRIAVISDLNGSYGSTSYGKEVSAAVASIIAMKPDLVISTGDMIAGQKPKPHLTADQIAAMWKAFHNTVTDPITAAGIPLLVTPGNHDASAYPGFESERRAFNETWTAHAPEVEIVDGEYYPFRYAVSFKGVLLVGLDATIAGPLPPEESDWLSLILIELAPQHHATVVFGHLPIWPVAENMQGEALQDNALLGLFARGHVSAYLSGHQHAYYPARLQGVLLVAQACLGAAPRALLGTKTVAPRAYTVLEIGDDGAVVQYALKAPAFTEKINQIELPTTLGTGRAMLKRSDLEQE